MGLNTHLRETIFYFPENNDYNWTENVYPQLILNCIDGERDEMGFPGFAEELSNKNHL